MAAAAGVFILAGCEGGDLYSVDAPDWISARVDSINASKSGDEEQELLPQNEDVYTVGATDYSNGFWQAFSKYYVIPENEKFQAQFVLHTNPDNVYYKNFVVIVSNDVDRGGDGYKEYGAWRYDFTNDSVTYNSQWGDYLFFKYSNSNMPMAPVDNVSDISEKMNGTVTLTIDRSRVDTFYMEANNGTVRKTYTQPYKLTNLNPDLTNENIRIFVVVDGSYIEWKSASSEPIGGYTSAEDKQPVSMELAGIPSEVLLGTELNEAMAGVTGVVTFEQGVTKKVTAEDLQFQAIPDMDEAGIKTLVVIYNKTFKGENCSNPIIFSKTFSVVKEFSAYTETLVVPTPTILGAEDNSTGWWGAHTENIKVEAKETKVVNFTNYTTGANNWNNFVIVLCKASNAEYAVVRSDNYGWGDGYGACTPSMEEGRDFDTWRAAMNGAHVTAYITNNGDGTADVKAVMTGTDGAVYTQQYTGINTVDADDFWFRFTVDGCHLVFDRELGNADCSTAWWGAHTTNVQVPASTVCTVNFTNYTSGASNWNNFVVVLCKDNNAEYAVVRADNYGWGDGYAACTHNMEEGRDFGTWLAAMNGAKVTMQIANNGDGTADVKVVMHGTDGKDYTQDYIGINTIDPDNFWFRFTVDSSYLVFE